MVDPLISYKNFEVLISTYIIRLTVTVRYIPITNFAGELKCDELHYQDLTEKNSKSGKFGICFPKMSDFESVF